MSASRRPVALAAGLALVSSALVLSSQPAHALGPGLVIGEVYGGGNVVGGGGAIALFQNDFVELQNTTTDPISLSGKSLQYRAPGTTGVATSVLPLPDAELPAGGKFLVQGAGGTTNGAPLPIPDAVSTMNLGTTAGEIFIADTTEAIDPNDPAGAAGSAFAPEVVDFLGWGAAATSFEGTLRGPGGGVLTSVTRTGDDTDNNGPDFAAGTPLPEACGCVGGPDVLDASIAEVQGTGATSPLLGDIVTTEGVVTATYTSGGFNGFYLQTGGSPDTLGASDAVFVSMGNLANNTYPAIDESVEVTGVVAEVNGATQLTVAAAGDVVDLVSPLPAVVPLATAWSGLDTATDKEAHEGELVAPQGASPCPASPASTAAARSRLPTAAARWSSRPRWRQPVPRPTPSPQPTRSRRSPSTTARRPTSRRTTPTPPARGRPCPG
jgi:predicted extracellular nuclease